jgi:tetratricopeptide (TPR) repeat protein
MALKINPDDHESWYNRGFVLRELGRYQEAIECFDKALSIDPSHIREKILRQRTTELLRKTPEKKLEEIAIRTKLMEVFVDDQKMIHPISSVFKSDFSKGTKTLSEKGVKTILDFLKKYQFSVLFFGSFSIRA